MSDLLARLTPIETFDDGAVLLRGFCTDECAELVRDIERVAARVARIPDQQASSSDRERLRTLDESLRRVVFGQDEAGDARNRVHLNGRCNHSGAQKTRKRRALIRSGDRIH